MVGRSLKPVELQRMAQKWLWQSHAPTSQRLRVVGGSYGQELWNVRPGVFAPVHVCGCSVSVMGGVQAATVLSTVSEMAWSAKAKNGAKRTRQSSRSQAKYEHEGHPYYASGVCGMMVSSNRKVLAA